MFQTPPSDLTPASGQTDSSSDPQLPRGECGFIYSELDPDTGGRQRCVCRSFWLDKTVPGSRCECGHGAWTHEREPVGSVSMEEHLTVVEKLKGIELELRKERAAREEMAKTYNDGFRSVFNHMANFVRETGSHMVRLDDKIESVMDKTHDNVNELDKLRTKIEAVDDAAMDLEDRVEKMGFGRPTRSLTPLTETAAETVQLTELPIRDRKLPDRWSARVIFVPNKEQERAFEYDSPAFKRCESRNLNQEIHFTNRESATFVSTVEKAFSPILRGRSWMPLMCYRESPEDRYSPVALKQLPPDQRLRPLWSYDFLEAQCLATDKMQGDVIYIALQLDEITWNDIKLLPATAPPGSSPFVASVVDQTFWQHDEELDGPVGYKSLDSLMYDYSEPPPYSSRSSRAHSHTGNDRISPLDVLASASLLDKQSTVSASASVSISDKSFTERSITELSSITNDSGDTGSMRENDEHRDKRTRLPSRGSGTGYAFPAPPATSSPPTSSSASQTVYLSGRSKRKVPSKQKEPVRHTEFRTPLQSLLHRHVHKDKDDGEGS